MSKYSKLSPADFRQKLKNSEYESLTGAKRAIGKIQEWTEKEREGAKTYAAKHFGEEPGTKPAKKAPKKAAKPKTDAAKKALTKKKAGKPMRGAVKTTSNYGPGKGRMKKAPKKAASGTKAARAPKAEKAVSPRSKNATDEVLGRAQETLGALTYAADLLEKCKTNSGANVNVSKGLEKIAETATRLVDELDRSVVSQLTAAEKRGADLFLQAAPSAPPPGNGAPPGPVQAPVVAPPPPGVVVPPPISQL